MSDLIERAFDRGNNRIWRKTEILKPNVRDEKSENENATVPEALINSSYFEESQRMKRRKFHVNKLEEHCKETNWVLNLATAKTKHILSRCVAHFPQ